MLCYSSRTKLILPCSFFLFSVCRLYFPWNWMKRDNLILRQRPQLGRFFCLIEIRTEFRFVRLWHGKLYFMYLTKITGPVVIWKSYERTNILLETLFQEWACGKLRYYHRISRERFFFVASGRLMAVKDGKYNLETSLEQSKKNSYICQLYFVIFWRCFFVSTEIAS